MTYDMPKRIELFYQDAVDNLRFVKQQQWTVTNYAFLAYSALVALAQVTGSKLLPLLYYALALVWFYNAAMLALLLADVEKFRRRIGWIYAIYFSCGERANERLAIGRKKDKWQYGALMIGVSLVGALIAGMAIHELAQ